MRRIAKEANPSMGAHPRRQRVTIYEFPVHQRRCLFDNRFAHRIPAFEYLVDFFEFSGEGPGFFDVVLVGVSEDPAAVGAVLDGAEEEMHVWSDPAVEGVAVFAELTGSRVGDHVGVGEPGRCVGMGGVKENARQE